MVAIAATKPPSASEPVSPIKTAAGCTLKIRNPIKAPATHAPDKAMSRFNLMATVEKNTTISKVTLAARPSSPSVKFAPLTVPIIII